MNKFILKVFFHYACYGEKELRDDVINNIIIMRKRLSEKGRLFTSEEVRILLEYEKMYWKHLNRIPTQEEIKRKIDIIIG